MSVLSRVCAVAMLVVGCSNPEKNEVTPAEMPLKDGPSAMVPVPAGDFWMGANEDSLALARDSFVQLICDDLV